MNILAFRIYGKFAHFRKFYTTTSPLTFQLPPFTVVRGILAAILGLDKDCYNEEFQAIKIGVKIDSDLTDKKMFGMNYLNTKSNDGYIQVKMETIVNPSYTIFIGDENFERYNDLKNNLENRSRVYTPYLGISEFTANIEYLGEKTLLNMMKGSNIEIDTAIPSEFIDGGKNIDIQEGQLFEFEKIPYQMDNMRNLKSLKEFLFNPKGEKILLKTVNYYRFNDLNIILG